MEIDWIKTDLANLEAVETYFTLMKFVFNQFGPMN